MICKDINIVFQEVPNEISISFSIAGCKVGCVGCHSAELWYIKGGYTVTEQLYRDTLTRYQGLATNVLFLGGEWEKDTLIKYLEIARNEYGMKTCLYTGECDVSVDIKENLTYLKTGKWLASLGGLESKTTNQRFVEVETNKNLNELFWRE